MGEFAFGQPVRRKEDPRLLSGHGTFIEDRRLVNIAPPTAAAPAFSTLRRVMPS